MIRISRARGREAFANDDRAINRHAVGGQDGIFANIGQECGFALGTNRFSVSPGKAIVQGVDFSIEVEEQVELLPVFGSTTTLYSIFIRLDMSASETISVGDENIQAQGIATLIASMHPSIFPPFPASDNLDANPNGVVILPLYRFRHTAQGVQDLERCFNVIQTGALSSPFFLRVVRK